MQTRHFPLTGWSLAAALGFILLTLPSAGAAAQSRAEDALRLSVFGSLGFAGSVATQTTGLLGVRTVNPADLSPGFGARFEVPLHRHFTLGGQAAVGFWRGATNPRGDYNNVVDVDAIARGRLPLGASTPMEVYLALPFGLTFSSPSFEHVTTVGFNVSFLAGFQVFLLEGFGLLAEAGYALHALQHSYVLGTADFLLQQVHVNAGVLFLF